MNNPNPLVPQGSLLEQKSKSKSNLVIAVITILAVHLVLFGGLLMQGCKREKAGADNEKTNTFGIDTNLFANTNVPAAPTNYITEIPSNPPPLVGNVVVPPIAEIPIPAAGKEYTVVKGDSFYKIAKAHGISLTAMTKANPNADSRKLQPGQKLQLPAPTVAPATGTNAVETPGAIAEGGHGSYTVKAGDTLTKIAKVHGTSVNAIKATNGLKTDRLTPGQSLKLPPAKKPAPVTEPAPATTSTNRIPSRA